MSKRFISSCGSTSMALILTFVSGCQSSANDAAPVVASGGAAVVVGSGGSAPVSYVPPATGGTSAPCSQSGELGCGGSAAPAGTGSRATTAIGGTTSSDSSDAGVHSDLGDGVTITVCAGMGPPNLPPASFPSCPSIAGCAVSRCVPLTTLPKSVPAELLGKCVCVPDEYIKTYGEFLARSCKSIGGAEGRCISTCVPQVNGLMDALPKDVCGDAERCAPCINPNDGTETGACAQGCDPGPSASTKSAPLLFKSCETDGRCVPKSIVPEALLSRLTILTGTGCTDPDEVWAPLQKSQNLKYNFPSCVPGSFSALGAPNTDSSGTVTQWGGCVPAWLAGGEALFLAQQTCPNGRLCAPCHDPLTPDLKVPVALEDPTGACPVALPSDPSGGLPPEGSGGVAGVTGQPPFTWGSAATTAAAPGASGASAAGGTTSTP